MPGNRAVVTLRLAFIREHQAEFSHRAARQQWDHQALLERLIHHCDLVETGNESWRFKSRF